MTLTTTAALTYLPYVLADLVALGILIGGLYLPRHGRRDLTAAYAAVNVGILAVTLLLAAQSVSAGLGLGLFGVLSIIRLRSSEISQGEIAYFFAALALGLISGMASAPLGVVIALMVLILLTLALVDTPRLLARNRHQLVLLDRAWADEDAMRAHLSTLLGGRILQAEVQRLDLVNDTTLVDVRYRLAG